MKFVRAPSFPSPTEVWSWLFERGCEPSDCRVYQGPDGWRGSGTVTRQASTSTWCCRCATVHEAGACR